MGERFLGLCNPMTIMFDKKRKVPPEKSALRFEESLRGAGLRGGNASSRDIAALFGSSISSSSHSSAATRMEDVEALVHVDVDRSEHAE
jgi:hypothetical protein